MARLPDLKPNEVKPIKLIWLHPDEHQVRTVFEEEALQFLANSIQQRGIEQPIVVRKNGSEGFIIKHGERRFRAAQLLGMESIPCILDTKKQADLDRLFDQIAENEDRENLNPLDMAEFYERLRLEHGYKVKDIPALMKQQRGIEVSRATVSNTMRLLVLPDLAKTMLGKKQITMSHALQILPLVESETVMQAVKEELEKCVCDNLAPSVSDFEDTVWDIASDHHTIFWPHELEKFTEEQKKELHLVNADDKRKWALNNEAVKKLIASAAEQEKQKLKAAAEKEKTRRQKSTSEKKTKKKATKELHAFKHSGQIVNLVDEWVADRLSTITIPQDLLLRILVMASHHFSGDSTVLKPEHQIDWAEFLKEVFTYDLPYSEGDYSLDVIKALGLDVNKEFILSEGDQNGFLHNCNEADLDFLISEQGLADDENWQACTTLEAKRDFILSIAPAIGLPKAFDNIIEGQR